MSTSHLVLAALIATALALRATVAFYYRDTQRILRLLGLIPRLPDRKEHYYRPLDDRWMNGLRRCRSSGHGWISWLPYCSHRSTRHRWHG
ncbi:hypothetical protein RYB01_18615 [Pseudomonas syringae]|nr:hypothetical protein [Pseudomonas syringae]